MMTPEYDVFGSAPGDSHDHGWLCAEETLLAVLGEPFGMPGIEPAVLPLRPHLPVAS